MIEIIAPCEEGLYSLCFPAELGHDLRKVIELLCDSTSQMLNWQKPHLTSSHQQHNEYYRENLRKETLDPRFKGMLCCPSVISMLSCSRHCAKMLPVHPSGQKRQAKRTINIFINSSQSCSICIWLLNSCFSLFTYSISPSQSTAIHSQGSNTLSINNIVWNHHFRGCKMVQQVKASPSSFFRLEFKSPEHTWLKARTESHK